MKTTIKESINIVGYTTDAKKHGLGQNKNFDFSIDVDSDQITNEFITGAIDNHIGNSMSYEFDVYNSAGEKIM